MHTSSGISLNGKPMVLIGPVFTDQVESVSIINMAFMEGLRERVQFIPHSITRRFGVQSPSQLNLWNVYYAFRHACPWMRTLWIRRPTVAHYAIGAFWNLEKGLAFLRLARLRRARTLAHLHAGSFIEFWRNLSPCRKRWALREFRALDGFVVLSEGWKQAIVREVGLDPSRVFVVNNPIERDYEESAMKFPIVRDGSAVLALGVMEKAKGVFDLIEAARLVAMRTPLRLILVGPEREPNAYRKITRQIGNAGLTDSVEIIGEVKGAQKLDLFRNASVFVLPSYAECFSLTILEAAAAGIPIVTTPTGATPEFFQDGVSALFVEPGNFKQIAGALVRLLKQPEERIRLAQAARQVFKTRLAREKIMADMYHVYQMILSRPRA